MIIGDWLRVIPVEIQSGLLRGLSAVLPLLTAWFIRIIAQDKKQFAEVPTSASALPCLLR